MKDETSKDTDLSPRKSLAKRERFWQYNCFKVMLAFPLLHNAR